VTPKGNKLDPDTFLVHMIPCYTHRFLNLLYSFSLNSYVIRLLFLGRAKGEFRLDKFLLKNTTRRVEDFSVKGLCPELGRPIELADTFA
jgi:hypothetical protein